MDGERGSSDEYETTENGERNEDEGEPDCARAEAQRPDDAGTGDDERTGRCDDPANARTGRARGQREGEEAEGKQRRAGRDGEPGAEGGADVVDERCGRDCEPTEREEAACGVEVPNYTGITQ